MDSFTRTLSVARREPGVLAATHVRVLAWLALAFVPMSAFGQSAVPAGEPRRVAASRVELDSLAGRAAAAADAPALPEQQRESLRRYAVELRARLRDGDFQPGDRIVLVTRGDSTSIDTLTVESDRTVSFRRLPSIALNGVLRSELHDYLSEQLRKYVKRDVVSAIPLVSVGVLGDVLHPGYYRVALEITMGDLLMVAGGPLPQADLTRVSVRRGQTTIVDERASRDAMVRRLPLGELGIEPGDEVVLKQPPQRNWMLITQIVGVATGLALTLHTLKVF
jgi:protein involved in polysaccharide export with SLBB domain